MSEMNKFEEEAKKQYVEERFDAINKYLGGLFKGLDDSLVAHRRSNILVQMCITLWFITIFAQVFYPGFGAEINRHLANLLFWLVVLREWVFVLPGMFGYKDEISGCIKALEILGFMDPLDSGKKKKIKNIEESFMAKLWAKMKRKAREDAYRPA